MTNRPTVALCVIAKDKFSIIEGMLDSTKDVFDYYVLQDTGSTDATVEVFEKWCKAHGKKYITSKKYLGKDYDFVVVHGREVLADFGKAREDSFKLAKDTFSPDFFFWMDTDDTLKNPEAISQLAVESKSRGWAGVLLPYNYSGVTNGLKPVDQWRERLIDANLPISWPLPVHETFEFPPGSVVQPANGVEIIHQRSPFDASDAGNAPKESRRNNLIMRKYIDKVGLENANIKMVVDLAYDHWEYQEWDECIEWYEKALTLGKNLVPEVLFIIYSKLGRAYLGKNLMDRAVSVAYELIRITPNIADGYLILAQAFTGIRDWKSAIFNADKVLELGVPKQLSVVNELEYTVLPLRIRLQALINMGNLNEALQVSGQLVNLMPDNADFKRERRMLEKDMRRQAVIEAIRSLMVYQQANNKIKHFDRILSTIPLDLRDDPIVRKFIKELKYDYDRKTKKVKFTGPKSIVFFAGPHYEPWDGESDTKKGIGGSEGMCIQMARGLAKLGNKVVVYNECGQSDGKEFDGVLYVDHKKWDSNMKCDVFVSLRRPDLFGIHQGSTPLIRATKQYLWLHDTFYGDLPLIAFHSPNNVFVLSEAHKNIIMQEHGVEDESIFWLTRNALNKVAVEYADSNAGERNPYRIVYASSYDRGLINLLKMWPKIKEAVPKAELHIHYGWDTYDAMMNQRLQHLQMRAHGEQMQRFKSEVVGLIAKSKDVYELGRISQNELYKKFAESALWVYPTEFYEISCINAMTAQAMGAVPVCTPYAALKEAVNSKTAYKVELDKIADATIYALTHQEELEEKRTKGKKWAREKFDMDSLAKEWDEYLNNN